MASSTIELCRRRNHFSTTSSDAAEAIAKELLAQPLALPFAPSSCCWECLPDIAGVAAVAGAPASKATAVGVLLLLLLLTTSMVD